MNGGGCSETVLLWSLWSRSAKKLNTCLCVISNHKALPASEQSGWGLVASPGPRSRVGRGFPRTDVGSIITRQAALHAASCSCLSVSYSCHTVNLHHHHKRTFISIIFLSKHNDCKRICSASSDNTV